MPARAPKKRAATRSHDTDSDSSGAEDSRSSKSFSRATSMRSTGVEFSGLDQWDSDSEGLPAVFVPVAMQHEQSKMSMELEMALKPEKVRFNTDADDDDDDEVIRVQVVETLSVDGSSSSGDDDHANKNGLRLPSSYSAPTRQHSAPPPSRAKRARQHVVTHLRHRDSVETPPPARSATRRGESGRRTGGVGGRSTPPLQHKDRDRRHHNHTKQPHRDKSHHDNSHHDKPHHDNHDNSHDKAHHDKHDKGHRDKSHHDTSHDKKQSRKSRRSAKDSLRDGKALPALKEGYWAKGVDGEDVIVLPLTRHNLREHTRRMRRLERQAERRERELKRQGTIRDQYDGDAGLAGDDRCMQCVKLCCQVM